MVLWLWIEKAEAGIVADVNCAVIPELACITGVGCRRYRFVRSLSKLNVAMVPEATVGAGVAVGANEGIAVGGIGVAVGVKGTVGVGEVDVWVGVGLFV